jgi:hypothetical protein
MKIPGCQLSAQTLLDAAAPRMMAALDTADAGIVRILALNIVGAYKILPGHNHLPDNVLVREAEQTLLATDCDVAPNFHPVAARVWQLLISYTVVATGQGAEPLRSAAPWPGGGENWLA